jgi:hypothetical protein
MEQIPSESNGVLYVTSFFMKKLRVILYSCAILNATLVLCTSHSPLLGFAFSVGYILECSVLLCSFWECKEHKRTQKNPKERLVFYALE